MKPDLIYYGFENLVDIAIDLGNFKSHLEAIEVAGAHRLLDRVSGMAYGSGYLGVDRRKVLVWPGKLGWICVREESLGKLEVTLHEKYVEAFEIADVEPEIYTDFILTLMAAGLSMANVTDILDASQSDTTQIEMVFIPLIEALTPALEIIEAQMSRINAGDPVLRRRIDEELSGAVGTFYNPNDEVQLRVWKTLNRLLGDDRRFNNLTRVDAFQEMRDTAISQSEIATVLAWVIDYAYEHAIIVPMWDAVVAPVGAEYVPMEGCSIKTIGILSQIGKLTRDDPEFVEKVRGIAAALTDDERYNQLNDHPGFSLFAAMEDRVITLEGEEEALKHLSWPMYQLTLQYSLEHGIVK